MPLPDELVAKRPLIATIGNQLLSLRELRLLLAVADRPTLKVF